MLGWVRGVAVESASGVVLPPLPLPSQLGNLPRLLFRLRRVHGGRWAEELRRRQLALRPALQSALQEERQRQLSRDSEAEEGEEGEGAAGVTGREVKEKKKGQRE